MTSFDIIPDIHGQFDKLLGLLDQLGWHKAGGSWRSPEPDRQLVFLGDFIDRGPNNGKVLEVVRELVDAGLARAIMGNHELNAIHFHNAHPDTGDAVRPHSVRNKKQHATFLEEFPVGSERASDVIDWFLMAGSRPLQGRPRLLVWRRCRNVARDCNGRRSSGGATDSRRSYN